MSVTAMKRRRRSETKLAGAHRIVLKHGGETDELRIWGAHGEQPLLVISVGSNGVAVRVTAASVSIEATETLRLEAKDLVLRALRELTLESGGNAAITVAGDGAITCAGDLATSAAAQTITATQGEIQATANDDIRLNGERVMMNCDE